MKCIKIGNSSAICIRIFSTCENIAQISKVRKYKFADRFLSSTNKFEEDFNTNLLIKCGGDCSVCVSSKFADASLIICFLISSHISFKGGYWLVQLLLGLKQC